jgi:hypothetical protein
VTTTQLPDPASLSLDELRSLRNQLQLEDDAVSYARRVAHELCAANGLGRLKSLDDAQLLALTEAIAEFEGRVSSDRRLRFDQLDALSAELVRRYRDGEADVDSIPE